MSSGIVLMICRKATLRDDTRMGRGASKERQFETGTHRQKSTTAKRASALHSPPYHAERTRLSRAEFLCAAIVLLAMLLVYSWTLAPTVTLTDSGELIVAAQGVGVAHPPGFPLW